MMTMTVGTTRTDVAASEWTIDDAVTRLREWGTDTICVLPDPPEGDAAPHLVTIGSAETSTLRLEDPTGRISRTHGELLRIDGGWVLRDPGSKNGIRFDGARKRYSLLQPGVEIGIGTRTLIAESQRSIALRGYLARILGWRGERLEVIDHALRSIRAGAARRSALVMCGDGDLVPLAQTLHDLALGTERPFIVCDPRRRRGKATVRAAENFELGMDALEAAIGGSLCIRGYRLPKDFHHVISAMRSPACRTQLIVCSPGPEDYTQYFTVPITVPPLASRLDEIDRVIQEYADDAMSQLGAPPSLFTEADREWVRMYSAKSLPDIAKGALRLVAINLSRNISNAADRLGMAPVSLSRWIGRRMLPFQLVP